MLRSMHLLVEASRGPEEREAAGVIRIISRSGRVCRRQINEDPNEEVIGFRKASVLNTNELTPQRQGTLRPWTPDWR
jgi:hypothetical protein